LTVQRDGKVGIGTVEPRVMLHVFGDIWATERVYCQAGVAVQHNGNWVWHNGNGWTGTPAPSDLRLKKEIQTLREPLEKVLNLRGVTFKWNELGLDRLTRYAENYDAGPGSTEEESRQVQAKARQEAQAKLSGTEIGLVAQEVEQVAPELVLEDEDGYLRVAYERTVALLVEAMKEQQQQIERLTGIVGELSAQFLAPEPNGHMANTHNSLPS
jgi:hypothetical protein